MAQGNGDWDCEDRDEHGHTALHLAAWFGDSPDVVEWLLQRGADANAKDNNGNTPLKMARHFNSSPRESVRRIIALLLRYNAKE